VVFHTRNRPRGSRGWKDRRGDPMRTGSWMGPPRGKRALRVGNSSTVFGVRAHGLRDPVPDAPWPFESPFPGSLTSTFLETTTHCMLRGVHRKDICYETGQFNPLIFELRNGSMSGGASIEPETLNHLHLPPLHNLRGFKVRRRATREQLTEAEGLLPESQGQPLALT